MKHESEYNITHRYVNNAFQEQAWRALSMKRITDLSACCINAALNIMKPFALQSDCRVAPLHLSSTKMPSPPSITHSHWLPALLLLLHAIHCALLCSFPAHTKSVLFYAHNYHYSKEIWLPTIIIQYLQNMEDFLCDRSSAMSSYIEQCWQFSTVKEASLGVTQTVDGSSWNSTFKL